ATADGLYWVFRDERVVPQHKEAGGAAEGICVYCLLSTKYWIRCSLLEIVTWKNVFIIFRLVRRFCLWLHWKRPSAICWRCRVRAFRSWKSATGRRSSSRF